MAGDDYVAVRGRIKAVRKTAVLFAVGESVSRAAWIPRSCIHAADERPLNGRFAGEEVTLRIFEWKAQECGLLSDTDAAGAAGDLFGDRAP